MTITERLVRFIDRIEGFVHPKSRKGEWVWVGRGDNPLDNMEEA